jgi:hypothetical protein
MNKFWVFCAVCWCISAWFNFLTSNIIKSVEGRNLRWAFYSSLSLISAVAVALYIFKILEQ